MNKPFLKWAGGKAKLVPFLQTHLPPASRLVEPFCGGAALSMALHFDSYLLGDSNADVIGVFTALKAQKGDFITYAQSFFCPENNQPERFYTLREQFNLTQNPLERAALFVYLNRHAYNGLCRYNRQGGFNVPFGRYQTVYFPAAEMQHFISKAAKVSLLHGDFAQVFAQAGAGDVLYCDPPYMPLSPTASFTAYTQNGFTSTDQIRLAQFARQAATKTQGVLISNHDTIETRALYHGAKINTIDVQRNIAAKSTSRSKARELLAVFR